MPYSVDDILERYSQAKSRRSIYDSTMLEVAKYCWPPLQDVVRTINVPNEGQVRTVDIYDSTAIDAAKRMASGIFGYLMPVGIKWFDFVASDYRLNQDSFVKSWLSKATQAIHREIWRSNFQREMFTTIRSLCVFGTGAISVDNPDSDINYRNYYYGDVFFEIDAFGKPDVVFVRLSYTARQAIQRYGEDAKKSKAVASALDNASERNIKLIEFVHCVFPNSDYDYKQLGSKKYTGIHIAVEDRTEIASQPYSSQPYLITRLEVAPGEILGRSPAVDLLPDIKMLNAERKTFIEGSEKQANPPIMVEDDSVIGQPAASPGDLMVIRQGAQYPKPLQTGINTQLNAEVIAADRRSIREGFYNDLFNALANHDYMTATEVIQRVEEKVIMIAPIITSGIQKGLLDPLIMRTLELLPKDRLEEPPAGLKSKLNIVYQGRLAMAMSNMQTNAIETTLAKWQPWIQYMPEIVDNINLDEAFRMSALNAGVPAEIMSDEDDRDKVRAERALKQAAAEQLAAAESASKAYANVAKAQVPI